MQRFFLILGLGLAGVFLAIAVWLYGASGDFIASSEQTRFGSEIGEAERRSVEAMTGLELAPSTQYHGYHFESALDQQLVVLVSMPAAAADSVLAQPVFADATWQPETGLPTPASDLTDWPSSWGEPTVSGLRTAIDTAPGRQLVVTVGDLSPDTHILQISWFTY